MSATQNNYTVIFIHKFKMTKVNRLNLPSRKSLLDMKVCPLIQQLTILTRPFEKSLVSSQMSLTVSYRLFFVSVSRLTRVFCTGCAIQDTVK
jgi:hypothetical protein